MELQSILACIDTFYFIDDQMATISEQIIKYIYNILPITK